MKQELSLGQKAVGASFNPSRNPTVDVVKANCANIIDIVEGVHIKVEKPSWLRNVLRTAVVNAVIAASSAAVKYLTWED